MKENLFFICWLVCGCCIEGIFTSHAAFIIAIGAALVAIGCAAMIWRQRRELLGRE